CNSGCGEGAGADTGGCCAPGPHGQSRAFTGVCKNDSCRSDRSGWRLRAQFRCLHQRKDWSADKAFPDSVISGDSMKIYKTKRGPIVEDRGRVCGLYDTGWDELLNRPDLLGSLTSLTRKLKLLANFELEGNILAPIGQQEVWAAGVTYFRS